MAADGFRAAGVRCGLKASGRPDLALVVSERPAAAAGFFTTNRVQAAPVTYDRELLRRAPDRMRAIVANAGCANACTGPAGDRDVERTTKVVASAVGCHADEVLVLSTGVIGVRLEMDKLAAGVAAASARLAADGWGAAAEAIMTTDTGPKLACRHGDGTTILGIAKGAGMIAPDLATMLALVVTDAALAPALLRRLATRAVAASFNRIVVDGDMSTNDTVLVLANGASGNEVRGASEERAFGERLSAVCTELAKAIVADGEGATKLVKIVVGGAPDVRSAERVARAIGLSPLCKTAFHGADPNWGRIFAAAGACGVRLDPQRLSLAVVSGDGAQEALLAVGGRATETDRGAAERLMQGREWTLRLDLGLGEHVGWLWTCDLSEAYVALNATYTT